MQKDIRNIHVLKEMYNEWPFFRVTLDLLEMVLAKGDPGIAAVYDKLLVAEDLQSFGEQLRKNYEETKELLLQVKCSNSSHSTDLVLLAFQLFLYFVAN